MVSEEEFQSLALLARLDPQDPSVAGMRSDFNKILDYVEQIGAVDTSKVDESLATVRTEDVVRSDVPREVIEPASIAKIAPEWESGHFVVPGVIESE